MWVGATHASPLHEPRSRVFECDPGNAHALLSRAFAGHDRHRALGHAESVGEDCDQFGIGDPVDWRGIQTDEERITARASDGGTARTRHDANGQENAVGRLGRHVEYALHAPGLAL